MNFERESFGERRLTDTGLADEQGIVFPPAAENLDHPLELVFAADQRIDLAFGRARDQIGCKRLERI
jgi:hypothetical protein